GAAALGPYSVTVQAAVGSYAAAQTFTWTSSNAISLTSPGDQSDSEGDTVSLSLSATDSTSGTLHDSDMGLPLGLQINTSTGVITPGPAANGPYLVTIGANDGTYSAQVTFAWAVHSPITIAPVADQSNSAGASVSLSISATDSTSGSLSYSASGLPGGLSINS